VGWALGLGTWHSFFFVVIPIMAGGIGEGAIPLTIGYADILHQPQGELLAQVLPPIMLGNLTAIILAGLLNMLGHRRPAWTGNGHLQPDDHSELIEEAAAPTQSDASPAKAGSVLAPGDVAAALVMAMLLYLLGVLSHRWFGMPGPVIMLFITVIAKLAHAVPPTLEAGAKSIYRFSAVALTYPLLFAIGTVITPWNQLVAAFSLATVLTVIATVVTMNLTGFFVGRLMGMYPIDTAVVVTTHSGMGGTGDVAILTAAKRMQLMPFAQIATRIGGAITISLVLIVLSQIA
jgi:Na+/citrate or Na+/malate symporter